MFPQRPKTSLRIEEVISYLTEWQNIGYQVFEEKNSNNKKSYSIIFSPAHSILVNEGANNSWYLQDGHGGRRVIGDIYSLDALREKFQNVALQQFGAKIDTSPRTLQLSKGKPASNIASCVNLIGSAVVLAVFDPYLNDKSISILLTLSNLGVKYDQNLRLLTSVKIVQKKEITKEFVEAFTAQLNLDKSELRYIDDSGHQARYMILGNGKILFTGGSLNNLNINERAHIDENKGIREQFEKHWSEAKLIE